MFTLDKKTGTVKIGQLEITSTWTLDNIESVKNVVEIISVVKNAGYTSFRIPEIENGEYAILLTFYNGSIISLDIGLGRKHNYPPFEITKERKDAVKEILRLIGGEYLYPWGRVSFSADSKSGTVCIIIKYGDS